MAAAQAIAMLGIAISTEIGHDNGAHIPGIVATVFISLYFCAFGIGWVGIPWLYPAEVNSLAMRTKGAALATACDWLFNYIVVQTTPIGIHYLKWGLYMVYAILNASFVPLVYFLVVETAGKSLEEIDRWFAAHPDWLVHKSHHRSSPSPTFGVTSQSSKYIDAENFDFPGPDTRGLDASNDTSDQDPSDSDDDITKRLKPRRVRTPKRQITPRHHNDSINVGRATDYDSQSTSRPVSARHRRSESGGDQFALGSDFGDEADWGQEDLHR